MRETIHSVHDERGNFRETVIGDAPSSAQVEFDSKGVAKLTVKCYLADERALGEEAAHALETAIFAIAAMLHRHGIQVAGIPASSPDTEGSER